MSLFSDKTLMIIGGTGSLNVVLNCFFQTDIGEIAYIVTIKKQDDLRHEFQSKPPEVADKPCFLSEMFATWLRSRM